MEESMTWIRDKQIKRLCTKAGVQRVRNDVYDPVRVFIIHYIDELLRKTIPFTINNKRKTISVRDLYAAISLDNHIHKVSDLDKKYCSDISKNKSHKFILQKKGFKNYIRNRAFDFLAQTGSSINTLHFAKDFFDAIEYITEKVVIDMLKEAYVLCCHSNRKGLAKKDVDHVINSHYNT